MPDGLQTVKVEITEDPWRVTVCVDGVARGYVLADSREDAQRVAGVFLDEAVKAGGVELCPN